MIYSRFGPNIVFKVLAIKKYLTLHEIVFIAELPAVLVCFLLQRVVSKLCFVALSCRQTHAGACVQRWVKYHKVNLELPNWQRGWCIVIIVLLDIIYTDDILLVWWPYILLHSSVCIRDVCVDVLCNYLLYVIYQYGLK